MLDRFEPEGWVPSGQVFVRITEAPMLTNQYNAYRNIPTETWPLPHLGWRVAYHSQASGVPLVALVTCTQATYDPKVGRRGGLEPPTSAFHAHLKVFSPGPASPYNEFDIGPGYGPGQWAPLEGSL